MATENNKNRTYSSYTKMKFTVNTVDQVESSKISNKAATILGYISTDLLS